MKKNYLLFSLALMIFFQACEKDDSSGIFGNPAELIHQVWFDSEFTNEYTYNDANQVVEEKSKLNYTRHNYRDGRLISSDYYIDPGMYSSNFSVMEAALNRTEWVTPANTEINNTKTYFYDDNGKLIKSVNYLNDCRYSFDDFGRISRQAFYRGDAQTGYIDFVYDDNGNTTKRLHYWVMASGKAELQTTTEYEFDNKHNPWQAFGNLMQPGRYTNPNNIIKETYTLHFEVDHFIDTVQVTENTYRYNSRGYPVSKNNSETYVYYE